MTWISTDEAAELIGVTRRWLAKLIERGEITARAHKKHGRQISLESLPLPAQEKYLSGADIKSVSVEPLVTQSLDALPENEREQLLEYGEALRSICEGAGFARVVRSVARQFRVTPQTVRNDLKNLRAYGFAGLLRKQRADVGMSRVADSQVIARIKELYLKPYRPKAAQVHRTIAKDYEMNGMEAPSYSSVRRVIRSIDPVLKATYYIGEKYAEDNFEPIFLRERPKLPRDWIDFDHHPCDHMVRFPNGKVGRPWITMAQDRCTSEIYALHMTREKIVGEGSYPGADAICLALRQGLLKKDSPEWPTYGLFNHLYADLGRDFRSRQVRQACVDMNIEIVHTRGYHGRSKPIERTFGVMENDKRDLPGYVGSKPEENPSRQTLKPLAIDPATLLSFDELEAELLKWVNEYNHRKQSRALNGLSPVEALTMHVQNGFVVREVRNEAALNLILMRSTQRIVRNVGIQMFGTPEQPRFFAAPEIWELIGQTVDVRWDPAKIGEIYVYKDQRFICKAENRELLKFGDSEETLERAREIRRKHKKRTEERMREITARAQYSDPHAQARAEQQREQFISDERRKIAAGAEADTVTVLLPEYAKAAKKQKLRAVPPAKREKPQRLNDGEELKSIAEMFPESPAPKYDEWNDAADACCDCGEKKHLSYCLDCVIEPGLRCEKCGGSQQHRRCQTCRENHIHRTKADLEHEGSDYASTSITFGEHLRAQQLKDL